MGNQNIGGFPVFANRICGQYVGGCALATHVGYIVVMEIIDPA